MRKLEGENEEQKRYHFRSINKHRDEEVKFQRKVDSCWFKKIYN